MRKPFLIVLSACLFLASCYVGSEKWLLEEFDAIDLGEAFEITGEEPASARRDGAWYELTGEADDEIMYVRFVERLPAGAARKVEPCAGCSSGTVEFRAEEEGETWFAYGQYAETSENVLSLCMLTSENFFKQWVELRTAEARNTLSSERAGDLAFFNGLFHGQDPDADRIDTPDALLTSLDQLDRLMAMASVEEDDEETSDTEGDYFPCAIWTLIYP